MRTLPALQKTPARSHATFPADEISLKGQAMVLLNKIYTRTGDKGTTALGTGERIDKHDLRIETYGTSDELNAILGIARLHCQSDPQLDAMLMRIQNDLFDLGADFCIPADKELEFEPLRIIDTQVERLEAEIDLLNTDLEPLNSFILPGGSPASAHLHQARTVARRAERLATALMQREPEAVTAAAVKYLNRLSDLFFVMARYMNDKGHADILWTPGASR